MPALGALISPTDPIAVIAMLKSAVAPRNLEAVIAGDSLFNDGVGVVIFALLVGIAVDGNVPSIGQISLLLLRQAGGVLQLNWVLGRLTFYLLRSGDRNQIEVMTTLVAVLGGTIYLVRGRAARSRSRCDALPATCKAVSSASTSTVGASCLRRTRSG